MRFLRENKGQGALELLLGVVIVIVIATLVGVYLKRTVIKPQEQSKEILDDVTKQIEE